MNRASITPQKSSETPPTPSSAAPPFMITLPILLSGMAAAIQTQRLQAQQAATLPVIGTNSKDQDGSRRSGVWGHPRYRLYWRGKPYCSPAAACFPDKVFSSIYREKMNHLVIDELVKANIIGFADEYVHIVCRWFEEFHDLWFLELTGAKVPTSLWSAEVGPELKDDLPEFHDQLGERLYKSWAEIFEAFRLYVIKKYQHMQEVSDALSKMGN